MENSFSQKSWWEILFVLVNYLNFSPRMHQEKKAKVFRCIVCIEFSLFHIWTNKDIIILYQFNTNLHHIMTFSTRVLAGADILALPLSKRFCVFLVSDLNFNAWSHLSWSIRILPQVFAKKKCFQMCRERTESHWVFPYLFQRFSYINVSFFLFNYFSLLIPMFLFLLRSALPIFFSSFYSAQFLFIFPIFLYDFHSIWRIGFVFPLFLLFWRFQAFSNLSICNSIFLIT